MLRRILNSFAVLAFTALVAIAAHAKSLPTAPIYTPDPIQVPAGMAVEDVKKAVRKAMFNKDWQILDVGPGHLQGKFIKMDKNGEKYRIVVGIKHDAKSVSISYEGSAGLNYSDGVIHSTYGDRVRALEKAIRAELGAF